MPIEQNATVLQFTDAALRRPIDLVCLKDGDELEPRTAVLPDNVISLARFARHQRRYWLSGPPSGEAA